MSRKRFSEREVLETLAWQGIVAFCYRCGNPFFEYIRPALGSAIIGVKPLLEIEREHLHEYKLGGEDKPYNCRYSCKPCHAIITNGTKATSAGSSKHKLAKVRRLRGELKPRKKTKIPSRPMQSGGKLQSRPFPKRAKSTT